MPVRPSGAAWAAFGRDTHMRSMSNPADFAPTSPLTALDEPMRGHSRRDSSDSVVVASETNSDHAGAPARPERPKETGWRKALYERQPFEDNYTDPAFMADLRTNSNLRDLRYVDLMRETLVVAQHVSIVVFFVTVYIAVVSGFVPLRGLVSTNIATVVICAGGYMALPRAGGGSRTTQSSLAANTRPRQEPSPQSPWVRAGVVAKSTLVMAAVLVLLSPTLHTMTKTYTDDTIWALTIALGFVHVVFADYEFLNGAPGATFEPNISMNAAVVAVVLLGSRLDDAIVAAAVVAFGLLLFTLSPIVRCAVRRLSMEAHEALTCIMCGAALGSLVQLQPLAAMAFVVGLALLVGAMPYCFVVAQSGRYKTQIQGPWDEARPENSAAAKEWATAGLLS